MITSWQELETSVLRQPSRTPGESATTGTEAKDVGNYWNPAATLVLRDLTDWYTYLATTIKRDRPTPRTRNFIGPLTHDATTRTLTARTIFDWGLDGTEPPRLGLAVILHHHHRWLTHYPTVGPSLVTDAHRYAWAIQRALDPDLARVQRITLTGHTCKRIMTETNNGPILCEGQLVGILRDDNNHRPSEIMCTIHPDHTTPASEWVFLVT